MTARSIRRAGGPVAGTVAVPGSKSLTNRALPLGALAEGRSSVEGALFSEDTRLMAGGLRALGIPVEEQTPPGRYVVFGQGGRVPATEATIDAGNAGTVARFLTAVAALGFGRYVVHGSARMRERPIGDLVEALRALGADVEAPTGAPPVLLRARGLAGGRARVGGRVSSQFLSALLMAAPYAESRVEITVDGHVVAAPYVDMTIRVMGAFGVAVERDGFRWFAVSPQRYRPRVYAVEPDASSAAYFFAAAALTGGRITVAGLPRDSLQGDVRFLEVLEAMGCRVHWDAAGVTVAGPERLRGVDADLGAMSDMAVTLAAVAPFTEGPVRIRGVAHIRTQESDRIAAAAAELRRLGQVVREEPDGLVIEPRPVRAAVIDPHGDHRIAMAFAIAGLRVDGLAVAHPEVVAKSFPGFFDRLDALVVDGGDLRETP